LRWSPWFQLAAPEKSQAAPKIELSENEVIISCEDGIPWIGLHVGGDIHHHVAYDEHALPKEVKLTFEEIQKMVGGQQPSLIRAIAPDGQETSRPLPAR
jgi:hypothetical protein